MTSLPPLQLAFYKGINGKMGAVQFSVQKPHFYAKVTDKNTGTKKTLKNYEGKFIPEYWKKEYPEVTKDDLSSREGAVFMEITSAKGPNVYDWTTSIKVALSIHDLSKILVLLEGGAKEVTIQHDPFAGTSSKGKITKKITFGIPKTLTDGISINAFESNVSEETKKHFLLLSGSEVKTLAVCFRSFIPSTIAWT